MDKPQVTKRGWDVTVVGDKSEELSRTEVLQKAAEAEEHNEDLSRAASEGYPHKKD